MSKRIYRWGNKRLIVYLAFLSAFAPLSTDMYLPALPQLTRELDTTSALSSLTISCFLLLFALSMILWGSLSDKYGRKPILLTGIVLYIISSGLLASVGSITSLLFWRGVQAVGSGAVSAMSLAIVKDILRGKSLERAVTWIQTLIILAPMCAPVFGGLLLQMTDWRGIFWCLALCGLGALAGAAGLAETRPGSMPQTVLQALGRIPAVLKNKKFSSLLVLFSATCMPFMSYLAVSSYVFQGTFGYSAQSYSVFFAFNAVMSLLGPIVYVHLFSRYDRRRIIAACLLLTCLFGGLIVVLGSWNAWLFALLCAPISFCTSAVRPPSTVLMMNLFHSDNGTVTSLINSGGLLFGSFAMFVCALPVWGSFITAEGIVSFCIGGAALISWLCLTPRTPVFD